MKIYIAIGTLLASAGLALAQTNFTFNVNEAIPQASPVGLTLSTNLTGINGESISDVSVYLDITGGFNGNLYAYLAGPNGGFAVLLNRTGVGPGNSFGYSDAGFNITLDDSAASNIHYYQESSYTLSGGQLTGSWAPDGENVDPMGSSVGSAPSTATLSSLDGTDPNGTWTLFIADLSNGGSQPTVDVWGLTITAPEPQVWLLGITGLLTFIGVQRWRKIGGSYK